MKRTIIVTALGGLLALAMAATSLQATAAPKPSIEDPLGDANFINDQGTGDGSFGDITAADAGTVSDLTGVTFTADAKNLYVTIATEAAPPAATGIGYRVRVNPDAAGTYCVNIEAYHPGANNVITTPVAYLRDACAGGEAVPLKVLGTQIVVPRKASKAFGAGATLKAPQAQAFLYSGNETSGSTYPVADTTLVGTDYKLK